MFRKIAQALDERHERKSLERLALAFNKTMDEYERADARAQIFTELSAREVRHAFLATFPDAGMFLDALHSDKSAYLDKLSEYVEQLAAREKSGNHPRGVSNGAVLVQFWITALAWKDFKLADEMARQLEPLNRSGYETACAAGSAKPDDQLIEEWKQAFRESVNPHALLD